MKTNTKEKKNQQKFIDVILDKPLQFDAGEKHFFIFPKCIGTMLLLSQLRERLIINESNIKLNPLIEALRLSTQQTDIVLRIIAIFTFARKKDILDEQMMQHRIDELRECLLPEDMATLLLLLLQDDSIEIEQIKKHFKLDVDQQRKKAVAQAKNNKNRNTFSFGGRTIYGSLINFFCEKYGWTLEQVIWETSYASLILMHADCPDSIYLSDDERKGLHGVSTQMGAVVNGDDKEALLKAIKSQNWE